MTPHLPPILLSPGLVLSEVGTTSKGTPFMKFETSPHVLDRHARLPVHEQTPRLSEVVVYVTTTAPAKFVYGYSYTDLTTKTVVSYHGTTGDPEHDRLGEISGM
jgi:hypothetical protein